MGFRNDFIWGGSSSAYQIEGAAYEDGKGPSVWDMYCKQPGVIAHGANGDVACDHYHRYREDIALMREIGYKAYRFSISWPRVLPEGIGTVNEKGLDFYDNLLDSLLEDGIVPHVTLFHWDYPYALFRRGGWMNPDSPKWFAEYTEIVARRLGDRLKNVLTLNEPQCFIGLSFVEARHAPGIAMPVWDTLLMVHNVLLGNGMAMQVLRSMIPDATLGMAPTARAHYPLTDKQEDVEAGRKAFFAFYKNDWAWCVPLWSDPVFFGEYPNELFEHFGEYMPNIGQNDMKTIHQPPDIIGQNIYQGNAVYSDGNGGWAFAEREQGYPSTGHSARWSITPKTLYWGPKFLYERYKKPIVITENGMSLPDTVSLDGKVHDPMRIDFLHRHLLELRRAADDGVDISGYFHWCTTDNFEWAQGYQERFGMIHCDFVTQKRTLKDSAYWYAEVIRANGENI